MARVKGITGNKSPKTGEPNIYEVIREDNTTPEDYAKVTWQLYLKDESGKWIKHPKSPERTQKGAKQSYTFGELFTNQELMLTAFNEKPVLSEPPALNIKPIAGDPKITKLFFTDLTGKTLEEVAYNQRMMIQIHTVGMLERYVNYVIFDDVNGTIKEVRKGQPKKIIKPNGVVNPEESFMIDMPIRTAQSTSANEHHFKIKIWDVNNEANFLEQELKIKNQTVNQMSDPETVTPVKTGTSQTTKPKEEKGKEEKECYCKKEFSVDDIKAFYNSKKLFTHHKCPLPAEQKTYIEFTKALNKAMKDNDINTCLRKAHFLAQIQVESDRLNTTLEYDTGWDYDHSTHYENYQKYLLFKRDPKSNKDYGTPKIKRDYNRYLECLKHGHNVKGYGPKYKGRGLLQLTWKDTYQAYFDFINEKKLIDTPDIIANNLSYACNASTWYWRYRSNWGDLNIAADRDDVYYINIGVNGGFNHFSDRINNVKKILELMKVQELCINIKNLDKKIGKYKYSLSKIKDSKYGKDRKDTFEKFDDK